tara:strand:+ start:984 stop:1097 length:114 start_codon:yes stop_codon:yes gene_type:complete
MEAILGALMLFIVANDIVDKVSPWVSDKVDQYTEAKE